MKKANRGRKPSKTTLIVIDHLLKAQEAFASDIEEVKPGTASAILRRLEKAGYLLLEPRGAEEKFKKIYRVKQNKLSSLEQYREELNKELNRPRTLRNMPKHSGLPFIEYLFRSDKTLIIFCILLPLGFLLAASCLIYTGNVRELQYILERAVIMTDENTLRPEDLVFSSIERPVTPNRVETTSLNLDDIEKNAIQTVLEKHKGNVSKSAKELGITRAALYRRLDKYEL